MAFAYKKRRIKVLDSYISYIDTRAGEDLVVFLHGNPLSSYVWRKVIPRVQGVARCISPDLLGMGDSGKEPHNAYRFDDHYRYFSVWIDSLKLDGKYIFVCHELGSMIAFRWCMEHEDKVKAIIHMESICGPFPSYDDIGPQVASEFYRNMRHNSESEEKVIQNNYFLEMCLSEMTLTRKLTDVDMESYRKPYTKAGESRRPTLTGVKELPVTGDGPEDVIKITQSYHDWMVKSDNIPKLYIHSEPGLFSNYIKKLTADWSNQLVVNVKGRHVPQEESPEDIGRVIVDFIKDLEMAEYEDNQ